MTIESDPEPWRTILPEPFSLAATGRATWSPARIWDVPERVGTRSVVGIIGAIGFGPPAYLAQPARPRSRLCFRAWSKFELGRPRGERAGQDTSRIIRRFVTIEPGLRPAPWPVGPTRLGLRIEGWRGGKTIDKALIVTRHRRSRQSVPSRRRSPLHATCHAMGPRRCPVSKHLRPGRPARSPQPQPAPGRSWRPRANEQPRASIQADAGIRPTRNKGKTRPIIVLARRPRGATLLWKHRPPGGRAALRELAGGGIEVEPRRRPSVHSRPPQVVLWPPDAWDELAPRVFRPAGPFFR